MTQTPDLVVLYTGRRGEKGDTGVGDPGPRGFSFNAKGIWANGQTYAPGDGVSAQSTAAAGITSLFIQRDTAPESVSTVEPRVDTGRWLEVGPQDLSNVTGTIWRVVQALHGFTSIGQPVGYSVTSNRWVLASNQVGDEDAVAVVRDIISPSEFILQSSGEITGLDPSIIMPAGATEFIPGRFYYVDRVRGFLTLEKTVEATNFGSQAIIVATGPTQGVVLQWQNTPNVVGRRAVGFDRFFYAAAPGQTVFTGVDLDGNVLVYQVTNQTQVLIDGVELSYRDDFDAITGTSIVLASPLAGGESVEIRTLAEPLDAISPSTALPLDNIATLFDGVTRRFPLTVGAGLPLALGPSQNCLIWLDGNTQEPYADYLVIAGATTDSDIEFTEAPAAGARFWGLAGTAISNLSFLEVDTLIADVATIGTLNFTSGNGGTLALSGGLTSPSANITTGTVGTLSGTSLSYASGAISGTLTLGNLTATTATIGTATVAGTATIGTISATTATIGTATVTGALAAGSASITGALSAGSGTITGTLSAATLNATSFTGTNMTLTGQIEGAGLRATTIQGPTAGGQIVATNMTFDEGTF